MLLCTAIYTSITCYRDNHKPPFFPHLMHPFRFSWQEPNCFQPPVNDIKQEPQGSLIFHPLKFYETKASSSLHLQLSSHHRTITTQFYLQTNMLHIKFFFYICFAYIIIYIFAYPPC